MRHLLTALLTVLPLLLSLKAHAMVTEVGLSYGYTKKTFNATNFYQTESKSSSLSFYVWEKIALEFSYTDSFYESQESDGASTRTVQQSVLVSNGSIVFMLTDKRSLIQPYIKAGGALIKKSQIIKYPSASAIEIPESSGVSPSYGAGLKFALSERFSIKVAYEIWQTPLSDNTKSEDASFKAGLSWYL